MRETTKVIFCFGANWLGWFETEDAGIQVPLSTVKRLLHRHARKKPLLHKTSVASDNKDK